MLAPIMRNQAATAAERAKKAKEHEKAKGEAFKEWQKQQGFA